jgi:hypothetical protein
MPELALAAFGALKTGFGALTGATATAGASAAGAGSLLGASQFASGLKLLAGIGSGVASFAQAQGEASQTMLQAGQEQVAAQQRSLRAKRQLAGVLGDNKATFAAAGIDIGQGIAAQDSATQTARTDDELSIDRRDTDFRRELLRLRAKNIRRGGAMSLFGSLVSAGADFATGAADANALGVLDGAAADPWGGLRRVS